MALTGSERVSLDLADASVAIQEIANLSGGIGVSAPSGDTTGVTDFTRIAASIAALPSAGGVVQLKPGTFYINGTILLPDRVTLRGCGKFSSTVKQADGANLDAVIAGASWYSNRTDSGYSIAVENLGIDGNKANQTGGAGHGVAFMNFNSHIARLRIDNCRGDGIHYSNRNRGGTDISNTSVETTIEQNEVFNSGGSGIAVTNPGSLGTGCTDGFLIDNIVGGAGAHGVLNQSAAGWRIVGNHIYNSTLGIAQDAFHLTQCFSTRVAENYVEDWGASSSSGTYYGISADSNADTAGTVIADNVLKTSQSGNAGNTYAAIFLLANTSACRFTCTGNLIASRNVSPAVQGVWSFGNSGGTVVGVLASNVHNGGGIAVSLANAAGLLNANNSWNFASAFPSTGAWTQGTVVWNTGAAAAGSPGWICTTAGTSGTWKTMAVVAA